MYTECSVKKGQNTNPSGRCLDQETRRMAKTANIKIYLYQVKSQSSTSPEK